MLKCPTKLRPTSFLWRRLTANPSPLCLRKVVAQCTPCGWSLLWHRAESCDQDISHLWVPLFPAVELATQHLLGGSFVFGKANSPLSNIPWGRGNLSQCNPEDPCTTESFTNPLQTHSPPLSPLFPTALHEKGPLPSAAPLLSSLPISSSKPCFCHVPSLQLCRLFF